jgi:hypothetical protein
MPVAATKGKHQQPRGFPGPLIPNAAPINEFDDCRDFDESRH